MAPRVLHYSDLENAYDTPERIGRVAGVLRARDGPDALVAGSGDNTAPGVLSLVTDGRQALDFFEAVEPDADTLGNHDFDNGRDALDAVIDESPHPWTVANVTVDGRPIATDRGVTPTVTVEVDGETVGLVGVVAPETPSMVPHLSEPTFSDPVAAVRRAVDSLAADGADYVVALAHTSDDDSRRIARETAVDAVLAGHAHDPTDAVIDGTVLTRPGASGRLVYEVDLGTRTATRHETAEFPVVDDVAGALRDRIAAHGLDEVVDTVDDPLSRDRAHKLHGEWRLGNFVADAYRWATGADVGLQNAGGIREGPPLSGPVTVGELVGLSPFEEPVVVAEVTGDRLRQIAREADGRAVDGVPDYWWGHVSGLRIDGTPSDPTASVGGDPIDPAATYRIATPAFVLGSDREFPSLSPEHRVDAVEAQYEVIVAYAREHGVEAPLDGRLPEWA
jgi:2',3'-cyclic-nucleotide 2'-phosphodiesterase (5'-nucleotidase family)